MERLEWIPALTVGNAEIDEEHKTLFALINKLGDLGGNEVGRKELRRVADELARYVHVHFTHEESLFIAKAYPGAAGHIDEHRAFVGKVAEFHSRIINGDPTVAGEMTSYLRTWLSRHIAMSDKKYRPWLADRRKA